MSPNFFFNFNETKIRGLDLKFEIQCIKCYNMYVSNTDYSYFVTTGTGTC